MQLASLTDAVGRNLIWSKPNPQKSEFQLRDEDTTLALLTWGGAGSRAQGSTADGHWTLNRGGARNPLDIKGALQPRIVVQPQGGGDAFEIAPGFEESVSFGGDRFGWQMNATTRVAKWVRESGEVLVTTRFSPGASDAEVLIDPQAAKVPELPLLILTGWYALRNGRG